jgi:sugar O-acyltransferase (sialic acid O-acetyltransferase NeuD family)
MKDALPIFAIYGTSGCGRGVLPVADAMLSGRLGAGTYELVFVDDAVQARIINGRRVLTYAEFVGANAPSRAVCIAIANSLVRARLAARCSLDGVTSFAVTAENVVILDDVQVGEGAILSPFVTLTSNIRIGRHFHANLYSYVEHDCVIGDFVTFAPGVHCNGNVTVEDYAYLGAGCIVLQGRPGAPIVIGRGAVIGMGAVVTHSVSPNVTVVGNPARILEKT